MYDTINESYTTLEHHGVKGQKWGVRRAASSTTRVIGRALSRTHRAYSNYRDNRNIRKAYTTGQSKYIKRLYKKINQLDGAEREKYIRKLESASRVNSLVGRGRENLAKDLMRNIKDAPIKFINSTLDGTIKGLSGRMSNRIQSEVLKRLRVRK